MLHLPGLDVASGSAEADFLNISSMFGTGSVRATNYASTSNYQQMYNEAIGKSNPYWPRPRENRWVCFKMGTLPISKLGGSVGFPMLFRQPPVAQANGHTEAQFAVASNDAPIPSPGMTQELVRPREGPGGDCVRGWTTNVKKSSPKSWFGRCIAVSCSFNNGLDAIFRYFQILRLEQLCGSNLSD